MWIQTFQPDSPALTHLIQDGYAGFAKTALEERKNAGLPPYAPMAMIRAESPNGNEAMQFLSACRQQLGAISVFGPVAAPLARQANRVRFQLMLLAETRPALHAALSQLSLPKQPRDLRWSFDIDPYDGL